MPLSIDTNKIYKKLLTDEALTFPALCKIIKDKKVKHMSTIFLTGIFGGNRVPFKVEIFLTMFVIFRFNEIIFAGEESGGGLDSAENTSMNEYLIKLVSEIIILLREDILKHKNILMHKLVEFNEKFNIWKQMDIKEQLKLYSETYYELELLKLKMTQHKEASVIYNDSIIPLQFKIKGLVKYLAGEKGVEYLENYKTTHLKLTVMLEKSLRENLQKAFWAKLEEEISKVPPEYNQIVGLFKDINLLYLSIITCVAETRQAKLKDDMNAILDYEYLQVLFDNNSLTEQVILNTCLNIFDQLKIVGFMQNDIKINLQIKKIKEYLVEYNKGEGNRAYEYYPNLPDIFKYIMNLLEELQRFFMNKLIDDN
jgi:hypothetical protein